MRRRLTVRLVADDRRRDRRVAFGRVFHFKAVNVCEPFVERTERQRAVSFFACVGKVGQVFDEKAGSEITGAPLVFTFPLYDCRE